MLVVFDFLNNMMDNLVEIDHVLKMKIIFKRLKVVYLDMDEEV